MRSKPFVKFAFIAALMVAAACSRAATVRVPADYGTIQAAINVANPGDVISIADGTYTGTGNRDLDLGGKAITICSAGGDPAVCVIDCQGAGRGFYIHSGETPSSIVSGITIAHGGTTGNGGGMLIVNSSPTVSNCIFTGGAAFYAGGMFNLFSSPNVSNCRFIGNSALWGSNGGGMYNYDSSPTVTDTAFIGNSALYGGGVFDFYYYTVDRGPVFTRCLFSGNSASIGGGGMYNYNSNPPVTNCIFWDNSAGAGGGGIFNFDSSPAVINCTVSANSALGGSNGGGIYNSYSSAIITNCVLWANGNGGLFNDSYSVSAVTYSDLQDLANPTADSNGNFAADPLFADPANGNLHLKDSSPCINAGDNVSVPPGVTTDIDGRPRVVSGTVDLGAYEFQTWSAFLQPINQDGSSVFKAGSTIPIKFRLTGESAIITDLVATFLFQYHGSSAGTVNETIAAANGDLGNQFRYDPTAGQYIYNWSTKGLAPGCYFISANLGDGVLRSVKIGLR